MTRTLTPEVMEIFSPAQRVELQDCFDRLLQKGVDVAHTPFGSDLPDMMLTGKEIVLLVTYMSNLANYAIELKEKAATAPTEKDRRKAEMKELLKENLTIGLDMDYDLGSFGSGTSVNATVRVYFDGDEIASGNGYTSIPGLD